MKKLIRIANEIAQLERTAASYKDYVKKKKNKGEKPLSKEQWEVRVQGKGKKDKPKGEAAPKSEYTAELSAYKDASKEYNKARKKGDRKQMDAINDRMAEIAGKVHTQAHGSALKKLKGHEDEMESLASDIFKYTDYDPNYDRLPSYKGVLKKLKNSKTFKNLPAETQEAINSLNLQEFMAVHYSMFMDGDLKKLSTPGYGYNPEGGVMPPAGQGYLGTVGERGSKAVIEKQQKARKEKANADLKKVQEGFGHGDVKVNDEYGYYEITLPDGSTGTAGSGDPKKVIKTLKTMWENAEKRARKKSKK